MRKLGTRILQCLPVAVNSVRKKIMTETVTEDVKNDAPQFHKVVLTHPSHNGKVIFRSVSESRAKAVIENRFPRGSEAHLVYPDGTAMHYEAERAGEKGQDADKWAPFDPNSWRAPEEAVVPGDNAWADREG